MTYNNNILLLFLAENPRSIPDKMKLPRLGVRPLCPLGIMNMCNTMLYKLGRFLAWVETTTYYVGMLYTEYGFRSIRSGLLRGPWDAIRKHCHPAK